MHEQPQDKNAKPISEGDMVTIKSRNGDVEGEVQKIVLTVAEADREGVKNPPKIILKDQQGRLVQHNPESLEHADRQQEYQSSNEVGA
ncbi:hypothetical protein S40288_05344 [Stachybotrys chartarum IBT 40288]|nr:hypothetical protein S40288_05344 [Stachybotrys chartarum IBT 40288]